MWNPSQEGEPCHILWMAPTTPLCRASKRTQNYPTISSSYLHSQKAGLILIESTGKQEAGPDGGPVSAEAPVTAFVISQAGGTAILSPLKVRTSTLRGPRCLTLPPLHMLSGHNIPGDLPSTPTAQTDVCLCRKEPLWCGGSGGILGGAHRIWGTVAAWLAQFKPVGSGWPECKGEFLGCTLASECSSPPPCGLDACRQAQPGAGL